MPHWGYFPYFVCIFLHVFKSSVPKVTGINPCQWPCIGSWYSSLSSYILLYPSYIPITWVSGEFYADTIIHLRGGQWGGSLLPNCPNLYITFLTDQNKTDGCQSSSIKETCLATSSFSAFTGSLSISSHF